MWQDVLPVTVYCKAMGALLNTALAEIVTRIAALEVTALGMLGTAFVTSTKSRFRAAAHSHRNYNHVPMGNVPNPNFSFHLALQE